MLAALHNEPLKKIEFDFGSIALRHDGIMLVVFKSYTLINAEKSERLKQATLELGGGQKFPFLIYLGENCSTDDTLMQFARNPENKYSSAEAIVISSTIQKILGNLYNRFMKPVVPTKLFTNATDAEYWLKNG